MANENGKSKTPYGIVQGEPTMDFSCPYEGCGCNKPHNTRQELDRIDVRRQCATPGCLETFYGDTCHRCHGAAGATVKIEIFKTVKTCSGCGQDFEITPCFEMPIPYRGKGATANANAA